MQKILTQIAKEKLSLETLDTRKSDSLDFHDLAVWNIKEALEAAFHAGKDSAKPKKRKSSISCESTEDGKFLWPYPDGKQLTASFAHDESRYNRVCSSIRSQVTRRLCAPMDGVFKHAGQANY